MWPITGMPASVTLRIWAATRDATLELHGVAAGLLHEADGGLAGPATGRPRTSRRAGLPMTKARLVDFDHGPDQRHQLVDGDRQGGLVAVDIVGRRVADQQRLDAGLVEELGGVLVVAGQHRPALPCRLALQKSVSADPAHRPAGGPRRPEPQGGPDSRHGCSLILTKPTHRFRTAGPVSDQTQFGADRAASVARHRPRLKVRPRALSSESESTSATGCGARRDGCGSPRGPSRSGRRRPPGRAGCRRPRRSPCTPRPPPGWC